MILIAFIKSVSAQNWSLVMPNETLVYESKHYSESKFHTVWVDSIFSDTSGDVYYMNRISPGLVIDTLYDTTNTCVKNYNWFGSDIKVRELHQPQFCGAMVSHYGNKWEITYANRSYVIFPKSNVGSVWLSDSIYGDSMRVLTQSYEALDLFGILDSVKIFQFKDDTFKLSKNYGFINQTHLGSKYPEEYELKGVHNKSIGVVVPMGVDLFHYDVGDKFYRFEGSISSDGPNGWYYKRTVTGKSQVGDTLIYEYWGYEKKYWPSMNPLLNAFPNTLSKIHPIFVGQSSDDSMYLESLLVPVNLSQGYHGAMIKFNSDNKGFCLQDSVILGYEITGPFCRYEEGIEPRYEGYRYGMDTYGNNLMGYVKDGVVYGDTTLSVPVTSMGSNVKIYPNPAQTELYVEIDQTNEPLKISLRNLQGMIVKEEVFQSPTRISLDGVESGLYIVVITNSEGENMLRKKIMVL